MIEDTRPIMVSISCITYNQEKYIRHCLEGFVMQQTSFRFEAIVHDDASTDGTAAIIRDYEEKYPDIIKPIYENENQYSKHDGSLRRIMESHMHGKYKAVCEGDDYWTDPLKLQKQFDFMESHPECSLCFHAHNNLMPDGNMIIARPAVIKHYYSIEDAILGGGGFMATNSMFYRLEYLKNEGYPEYWKNCPIGDLPLMLFFASKGVIGYIDEIMSVYRINAIGSWSTRQKTLAIRKNHHKAILKMFDEFDDYTNYEYHKIIRKKKNINRRMYWKDVASFIFTKFFRRSI